ncbi:MAG: PKD domain-containing protein, partial [Roseburia sp.]|nr:PKD domain-containing protein [Roseburia sp.]MCM1279766.1 PKD domain-containing protein [Robinsoniella sp.]
MKRLLKRLIALCLTICLLPFADYSTALAAGNTQAIETEPEDISVELSGENNGMEPSAISENDGGEKEMLPETVEADRAGESVDCNMQIHVQIDKKGYVALNWQEYEEGAAAYRIYRNEQLIAETEETEFQDRGLERKAAYIYKVAALDEEGQEMAQDCSIQIELPDNYEVGYNNSVVLEEDMIVYDLNVYGELDLNGHSLTVLNCADLGGSPISFHGGSLLVNHDLEIRCSQYRMNAEEDYLYVGGNLKWNIWSSHYYGQIIELEKGTIEVKGDFLAGETDTFLASEDFYTIFNGEEKQTIELYGGDAAFGRVELANGSEEGVYAKEPFLCSELIQNDTRLMIGADEVKSGFELEEDMMVEGDFCLGGGTLDLAGHTLTVQGNLIQTGGTVFVNGGKLIIEKDYRIQSRTYNEEEEALEEYEYGKSTGILNMTTDGDEVLVKGGFYTNSRMDHQGFLTRGTMEVKGDFYEYTESSLGNFIATDEHKVILSGEGKQTVSFGINRVSASRFSNLELQNTSEEGIVFVNRPYVAGEISGGESRIEGAISAGSKTVFLNQYYGGDIYLASNFAIREPVTFGGDVTTASYLTLYDRMTVEGNVIVLKNCVTFMGGEMIVKKDFTVQGGNGNYGIKMTNEADRLSVYGDFYYDASGSMSKSAGTIEVKGNVEIVKGFMAEGSHVFLLNGDGKQEVSMQEGNAFYELWVENYSEDGVQILTDIIFDSIKENGCNVTYFSGMLSKDEVVDGDYELTVENFNLNQKQLTVKGDFVQSQGILKLNKGTLVVEGDFILSEGTVQMKGGSIIVKGSLIHEGGTIQVEDGSLIVEGDYRIQKRSGQEGAYSYSACDGLLDMTKEGGRVLVNGNFHTASTRNHTDYFTNGTLEIKGNLIQETGGNEYNLAFDKEHLLLLSGTGKQCVDFLPVKLEKPDSYIYYQGKSCIANLELANQSKEGIEFLNEPIVNGRIKDNHNRIEGSISIIGSNNIAFEDGYYGGDVALWCNVLSRKSLYIAGDLQIHSGLLLYANLEVEGNCDVIGGSIDVKSACMSVGGNLSVKNTSYGLYFSGNGKVVVGGNLDYQPDTYREGYLKMGTLEVKGDAVFNENFRASGSNTVIFSGEKKQTVQAVLAGFYGIELNNKSKEGVIASTFLSYSYLNANGCRIIYGEENDREYAITGFTLQEDYAVKGDLYLMDGKMDLNGHTMTVEGDLIQASGDMEINGGALIVNGSYRMQYRTGLEGSYRYGSSKGRLVMTKEKDQVLVCGDFYCSTTKSMEGLLTNGTMEVRGDFRQNAAANFIATGEHTVILGRKLDGDGNTYVQTVFFEKYPGTVKFHKVVLTKLYETGYVFKNDLSLISDEILYDYCDEEAPSAVTNISVMETECASITIAYEGALDNEKVLGYEIYRDGTKIGETSEKRFRDTGLKADREYTYQVFAFDEYRNVAKDSPECVGRTLVDEEAPEAVRGLYIKSVTGSSITIAWRKAADNVEATDYKIYRNGKEIAATNGELLYRDTGLLEGKVYMYQVSALDESGNESELGEEIEASVIFPQIDTIYPADGSTIGGETAKLTIIYKYKSSALENKVTAEYYDENNREWISIASGLEGEVLSPNQYYVARCIWDISEFTGTQQMNVRYSITDVDGNSDSRQVRYEINRTPPKAPANVKATSVQGNVKLSWEPSVSADCTGYLIFRRDMESNTCENIAQVSGIYTETYVDKKAVAGKEYEYWLVAVDKYEQKSAVSSSAFVVVGSDKEAPKIIKINLNERVNQKATISVEASDNKSVKSVVLYYRAIGQDIWYSLGEKQAEKNWQDKEIAQFDWYTNRVSDGRYEIKAVAKDAADNLSAAVTKECEVDNTGVSKVEILEGSATSTEIQLVWSQPLEKDISYFVVERKNNRSASILKSNIKATGCRISDLPSETEYVLRVVGYDLLGNRGEPSEWYTISTSKDTIAPIIKRIGPNISAYNSKLHLEAEIEDNSAVGQAVFSYSYDKINYEEIVTVNSYENSKKEVLSYLWDISDIKEGTVYVKFEAYDKEGNQNGNTEEVIAEYVIDRTPPKAVENVQISGTGGAIKLQWEQAEDVCGYEIYRAGEGTNFYMLLHTTTSDYFVDKNCSHKKTYTYQIAAVDRAGNRSELSEPVIWTAEKDTEVPAIHACTIKENEVIGGNPTIKLTASDNVSLKEINLKYRKVGEFAWEKIGDYEVSGDIYRLETVWDTTGLESGQYEFQAMAIDTTGNGSISYQKQFILDVNAPKAPDISVAEKNGKVLLTISENEEPDFSHYNIYKMSRGEDGYRLLKQVTANQFEDGEILPETRYYYYVEACDKAGNAARSSEAYILTSDTDVVPPNAKLSDVMGIEGREITFSGEKSTDNVRIESYEWDMGDGTILYGKNPKHIYQTAGEYRVILTVTDEKGNQASTTAIASVKDKTNCGIHTIYVKDSMDQLMAGAAVYICFADGTVKEMETDGNGKVIISGTAGVHAAAVFVTGYLIAEKDFNISVYEDLSTTIILQEGSMVGGEITAEKLSIEDIKKYNIDVTDEDNFFEYSYKVQASFDSAAVPCFEFQFEGSAKKTSIGNGIGFATGSGGSSGGENKNNSEISTSAQVVCAGDKPVIAYCTTAPASVKWLKDMYVVTVTIQNYADEKYVIEDSNVILNLPKGISLAKLAEAQKFSQSMGSIAGKSSVTASWIIKVDEAGEYQVSADFKGRLQPFDKEITAKIENTIKFGADSGAGLHLYVYPENTAYIGEKYYFQYQLKNESENPVYYVTAKFGEYRTTDFIQVVDTYVNGELTQSVRNSTGIKYYTASTEGAHIPVLCEGDSITVESLGAGQSIYGTYCEYFPGGGDPSSVYYELSNAVVKKLRDSNADIKVTVMPIQGHMTKANIRITLPVEDDTYEETEDDSTGSNSSGNKKNPDNKKHKPSTGKPTTPTGTSTERDPINVMTGAFESEQCVMAVAGVNDIRFQLTYNSKETDMEGNLGYGWHHNYESKLEDQNGLLKVWLSPYASLLFVDEDLMSNKVEGTYRDGEIWLGDMKPENVKGRGGVSRSTLSENSVSGNTISENSILENFMPENAFLPKESGNEEESDDEINALADNAEKPCSYVPISENMNGYSVEKTDEGYIFRTPDRTEYHYDEKGQLIKRINEKGQVLNISHPKGQLVISEPYTEKTITAVMNQDGNIVSLRDNGGNQVTFAYDAQKNLSAVTGKGGTSNYYSYDEGHRIVEGRDTNHILFVQNTYDEKGRVLIQDDGNAATKPVTLQYEDNEENGNTVITMDDMNGAVKTITANSLGKGLRYQDGIGGIFSYAYNEKGDMVSYRNADGTGEEY